MSDHGDYKEPKAGDWMLVIERGGGEIVACMKVESVNDGIARLMDNSAWGAETGQPIHRKWKDHYLWPCSKGDEYTDAMEMLAAASPDAFGEVYGILLANKRARGNAPEAPSPDDGWSPLRCIFCLSEMPNHTDGCTVGTPEKMAAYKAAQRL